jgi:hypothetical protein
MCWWLRCFCAVRLSKVQGVARNSQRAASRWGNSTPTANSNRWADAAAPVMLFGHLSSDDTMHDQQAVMFH